MTLKKVWSAGAVLMTTALIVAGCGGSTAPKETPQSANTTATSKAKLEKVLIGTAGEGGAYFYLGNGMANVINKNTSIKATAQATGGGVENIRRINNGEMDIGFVTTGDIKTTVTDKTLDPKKVMILTAGHASYIQVAVRADSDIKTMDQLFAKGKRIGIGEPGSALQKTAETLLTVHGLTMNDIKPAPLSQAEQANALKDKRIDGAVLGGGMPIASISDLATSIGVRVLPVTPEMIEKTKKIQPDVYPINIPAGVYKGIDQPVPVYATAAVMLVRSDLPEDDIYQVIKAIHEHTDDVNKVHPSGKEYTVKNAFNGADYYSKQLGLKFHPGAIKWYKEKGVWSGDFQ